DNPSATSSILLALIKPRTAIGIAKENDAAYTITVPRMDRAQYHITERIAELLRPLGIDPKRLSLKPQLQLPKTDKVSGRVGINISAGSSSRYAPVETYASI